MSSCANNLKQLGTAEQMYLQDSDEYYTGAYVIPKDANGNQILPGNGRRSYPELLYPYIKATAVFSCPDATISQHFVDDGVNDPTQNPNTGRTPVDYAYNVVCGGAGNPNPIIPCDNGNIKQSQLSAAASTYMMMDGGNNNHSWGFYNNWEQSDTDVPAVTYYGVAWSGNNGGTTNVYDPANGSHEPMFRHGSQDTCNFLYFDGHVKSAKTSLVPTANFPAGSPINWLYTKPANP